MSDRNEWGYTSEDYDKIDCMDGGINAPQNAFEYGQRKLLLYIIKVAFNEDKSGFIEVCKHFNINPEDYELKNIDK
jgi:hypothetical protein